MRGVIVHNYFDVLSFGPSDHGDQWSRLWAWKGEGNAMWEALLLSPRTPPHVPNGYVHCKEDMVRFSLSLTYD